MLINEGMIVEILRPGSGEPVATGDVGEIVVTRLHADYPLVRFGTGDMSRVIDEPSPCGRTAMRIAGWLGRADQRTKVKGMFVDPSQLDAVYAVSSDIRRLRLTISRVGDADQATLAVQLGEDDALVATPTADLQSNLAQVFKKSTGLSADVEIAQAPLANDGVLIHDARDYES